MLVLTRSCPAWLRKSKAGQVMFLFLLIIGNASCEVQLSAQPEQGKTIEKAVATNEWAIKLKAGIDPVLFAQQKGIVFVGRVGNFDAIYLFRLSDEQAGTADTLLTDPQIEWAERQVLQKMQTRDE